MAEHVIHVAPSGRLTFVLDDELERIVDGLVGPDGAGAHARIDRASHVEPAEQLQAGRPRGWTADLAPVGGPVLGPFPRRSEALSQERDWINAHLAEIAEAGA